MKKVYLMSEKGFVKEGYVKKDIKNMLGNLAFEGNKVKFMNKENNEIVEIEAFDSNLFDTNSLVKIVTDNLPIDFHMYDLKTCLL